MAPPFQQHLELGTGVGLHQGLRAAARRSGGCCRALSRPAARRRHRCARRALYRCDGNWDDAGDVGRPDRRSLWQLREHQRGDVARWRCAGVNGPGCGPRLPEQWWASKECSAEESSLSSSPRLRVCPGGEQESGPVVVRPEEGRRRRAAFRSHRS